MLMENYGSDAQKAYWLPRMTEHGGGFSFGITELNHGSDATWMETNAYRDGDEWVINGNKTWNTGMHNATHDVIFARTSGQPGEGTGMQVVQSFVNENRIRQAASSLGAAQYCIDESIKYARDPKPFGKPLAANQA